MCCINKSSYAFCFLQKIRTSTYISRYTKVGLFSTCSKSIVLYSYETWITFARDTPFDILMMTLPELRWTGTPREVEGEVDCEIHGGEGSLQKCWM